jgi:hypothetical protein
MAGASPFGATPTSSTINVVLVPLSITIRSTVFDPTAPEPCDGSRAPFTQLLASPVVIAGSQIFNGVDVGISQFSDGFRRAEFSAIAPAGYQNLLVITTAAKVSLNAGFIAGKILISPGDCTGHGVVTLNWLDNQIRTSVLPALTSSGTIDPTEFVFFLVHNITAVEGLLPNSRNAPIFGYHSATGSPVQTYAVADWDITNTFSGFHEASPASQVLAEWMDDPLAINQTPAWGRIGSTERCTTNLDLGGEFYNDEYLNNGFKVKELAFFSWFVNQNGQTSLGAGGLFSSNGYLKGPAKACPRGNTY